MGRRNKVGSGRVLLHVILTVLTGGLWLIVLFIKFLMSNSR
jgi:hypothetical protein